MQKVNEFGICGDVNSSLLQAITEEQGEQLRQAIGVRGLTSLEAATIREPRDRYKRALNCGYLNVEDRYGSDVQFCDRVHQEGRAVKECILDDMLAFANLPDPPRTRAQLSAGVAANAEHEHLLTKLVYFSHARSPEGFPHEFRTGFTKVWGYMFGKHLFSEGNYIDYLKTSNAHRALLTWKGVVKVPDQDVASFLEDVYEKNLPLVKQNLERKQNQSNIAKKRKAEEEA